jgi:hypothetical protein
MYLHVFAMTVRTLLGNTDLALIVLLGILAALVQAIRSYRLGTAVVLFAGFLHFLLYPSDSARFHATAELFIPIFASDRLRSPGLSLRGQLPDSPVA